MSTKDIEDGNSRSTSRKRTKIDCKEIRSMVRMFLVVVTVVGGVVAAAVILATNNKDKDTLDANPPVHPDVLVQCPWFPDFETFEAGGDAALPIFVLDVRDIPAYDPAEPLTLSLWIEQEDPIYPYRYYFNPSDSLEGPGTELEPGGETAVPLAMMEAEDSSGSSSGSASASDSSGTTPPTYLPPEDLYAALAAWSPYYIDVGPWGQYFFADLYRDSDITLRRSDFWPGLNLSEIPGEEADPDSVPDMYTRKVVQAQHEQDFVYAQLTLPLFSDFEWYELNAQFMRIDGGEANLKLLRNQSEDPGLFSLPLGGPGLFMASYGFSGAPLSMMIPSCSFWIYIVDSGPEVSIPETCADGFPLQEWDIESESEEGAPEEVAWCNCFDTCGGWNGGAFCEDYSLQESADVYDLLNCGENDMKVVNLTRMDEDLVIDALRTVFHGVCLPPEYTTQMVQDLRDGYEVTALFELERAADPALNETDPVVYVTSEMEVSDYVFHAFGEGVVETPWGEVAQLLSNMSVAPGEAYSYEWEIRIVARVTAEGDEGVDESTCRILIPEPYCSPELDADGDLANDCVDECQDDPLKTKPGECGCGEPDIDTDGDNTADCVDACPADPQKDSSSGDCGCGEPDTDTDGDGVANCNDVCDRDPLKITSSGVCGCGFPDDDTNSDGIVDCPVTCSIESRPNITSISEDSGAAGTNITFTGSWPLAVSGADVRVLTWFNGSVSAETDEIVVTSFDPTTITFESPGWSSPIVSDTEVQFTVLVLPAGTLSPGHPNTCSSTKGLSPVSWVAGQFVTYTYKVSS